MTSVNAKNKKGLSDKLFRLLPYILAVLLLTVLILREQCFLKKVEDLSVFLFDKQFFREMLPVPGGFLGLAGAFFTQFMYYPWLGALIWVLLLTVCYQLTVKVFNIPACLRALAIIPVALLVIGNMSLGYGIFIMREQDHFFAPLLGYMSALVPVFAVSRIRPEWGKVVMLAVWTAAGFPLLGTFAFVGTLSASLTALTEPDVPRKSRLGVFSAGIALILFVPIIEYNFYTTYRMADSWHIGLPSVSDDLWTHAVRAPLQLALLFLPVMSVAVRRLKEKGGMIVVQSAVFAAAIAATWILWYKDENFHTELAMSEAIDRFDWQKTVDIYRKVAESHSKSDHKAYADRSAKLQGVKDQATISTIVDSYSEKFFEPTRTMIMYRDIALLKLNRALDVAFTMKDGSRLQKSRTQIPMAFQSGKQIYMQYGLVNMSYRWCLEDVIEHNWSFGTLKYMSIHSVVMHEEEFARKYLNKLSKTLFYRDWAKQNLVLAQDSALMAVTQPYSDILPYMCFENRMTNDMVQSEKFIMRHYSEPEPDHATPEYDRAALFWAMRIQNIPAFWMHLYFYLQSNKVNELPRSVEEAAILYSHLEEGGLDLPYSKEVTDSYNAFQRYVAQHSVRNLKESAYPYSQKFGKTFFYYYYFMRNLQTY